MIISQGAPDSSWFSTPEGAAWLTTSRANPTASFDAFHAAWLQANPSGTMATSSSPLGDPGAASTASPASSYAPQAGRDTPGIGGYGQTGGEYDFGSLLHPAVPATAPAAGSTPAVGVNVSPVVGGDPGGSATGDKDQGPSNEAPGTAAGTNTRGSLTNENAAIAMGAIGLGLGIATGNPLGIAKGAFNTISAINAKAKSPSEATSDPPGTDPNGGISGAGVGSGQVGSDNSQGGTQGGPAGVGSSPGGNGPSSDGGTGGLGGASGGTDAGTGGGTDAGGDGDGGGCFVGATPILMANWQTKPIEDVRIGDMVLAFDGMGDLVPCRVVATMVFGDRSVFEFAGVRATAEHPFLTPDNRFVAVGDLVAGSTLVTGARDLLILNAAPHPLPGKHVVFNIEVEDLHTYVAGGFRVHNKYARGGTVGNLMPPAKGGHRSGEVSGHGFSKIANGIRAYGMGFADGGLAGGGFATANTHGVGAGRSIPHGLVPGASPGRADAVHASVKRGSYIMPADVVSAIGGGNTGNGGHKLNQWVGGAGFKSGAGMPGTGYARGGLVDVRLSSGEYHVPPEFVQWLGKGDPDKGAKILDGHVARIRAKQITHLRHLPPPK